MNVLQDSFLNVETRTPSKLKALVASGLATLCLSGCMNEKTPDQHTNESNVVRVDINHEITDSVPPVPEFTARPLYEKIIKATPELEEPSDYDATPLVTIEIVKDRFIVKDMSIGVELNDLKPLQQAVLENKDWMITANKSGTLDQIVFSIQPDSFDEFYPDGSPSYQPAQKNVEMGTIPNQIVYQLPGTTIDTALMSSALHHETAHALLERIDASDRPQDYLVKGERVALNNKYRELCSDIRSLTIQENTKQNIIAASALKSLIAKVPDWKSEIEPIINGLDENHFDLMQPTQGEAEAWEAKVQECQVDNPWRILVSKLFKEGQSQEDLELNQKYVDMYYEQLTDDWLLPLNTRTLYRVLKESTYIGNGKQASQLGHPVDSAQEIMASAINIATKFPEAMAIELQKLPKQESKLIYDLLKLVSDDIIQIHKNDLRFVQYINTQVSKVLNSQS